MNTGRAPALLPRATRGLFTAAVQSIQAEGWEPSFLLLPEPDTPGLGLV